MQKPYHLTRLAPTPSGFLHLGNVYAFMVTASLARNTGAGVMLRIDDMDGPRKSPEYLDDIFITLEFLGIPWHIGPRNSSAHESAWSQQLRKPLYEQALRHLRDRGLVYACRCSRSQLRAAGTSGCAAGCSESAISLDSPDVAWRVRTNAREELVIKGFSEAGSFFLPGEMHDFVVRRRDGLPAYPVCSLVDDHHFGTDLVVRGTDLLASTLAQLFLAGLLGFDDFKQATFFHHRLLVTGAGEKMSKTAGDTSVQYLRRQGASPKDIFRLASRLAGGAEVDDWTQFDPVTAGVPLHDR